MKWSEILRQYDRIVLTGGPRTGKTTLAKKVMGWRVVHTDSYIETLGWDGAITEIARGNFGDMWLIEGVTAAHSLRHGLKPDVVVVLTEPKAPQTERNKSTAKAVYTIIEDASGKIHDAIGYVPVIWDPELD